MIWWEAREVHVDVGGGEKWEDGKRRPGRWEDGRNCIHHKAELGNPSHKTLRNPTYRFL